jgi:hypothetical protein
MSVGLHSSSMEKISMTVQVQGVHDKDPDEDSSRDTPLPVASPVNGNRSWRRFWRRKDEHDLDAVAIQSSVFDDPIILELYRPPQSYENTHRFNPSARWTLREERVCYKWRGYRFPLLTFSLLACRAEDRLQDHVMGLHHVFLPRPRP